MPTTIEKLWGEACDIATNTPKRKKVTKMKQTTSPEDIVDDAHRAKVDTESKPPMSTKPIEGDVKFKTKFLLFPRNYQKEGTNEWERRWFKRERIKYTHLGYSEFPEYMFFYFTRNKGWKKEWVMSEKVSRDWVGTALTACVLLITVAVPSSICYKIRNEKQQQLREYQVMTGIQTGLEVKTKFLISTLVNPHHDTGIIKGVKQDTITVEFVELGVKDVKWEEIEVVKNPTLARKQ